MTNVVPAKTDAGLVEQVRRLRTEEGLSLTAIAKRLGRDKGDLSRLAKEHGIRFDAASTRELTETAIGGARLRRAKMAAEALATAEEALSKVKAASDAAEAKGWAVVFGVMIDKSLVLEGREQADHGAAQQAEHAERVAKMYPDMFEF
ncbi:hypothetical protein [Nocardia farcinica]|uniref:hypothetical protein n=1 Tax=Nocardia farcinica TaxID=37329 RepID=UPI00189431C2|nr:hypothetical protein [Nocardia farcinica]MBF6138699.1 hypothetical protein [Nocardia farcinica]MBF6387222.1 hypothetical protein [Nocardia farcinica]MBF6539506.1 hypothetical protein [Nocardia farcinica]